jgi:hypothetical protein
MLFFIISGYLRLLSSLILCNCTNLKHDSNSQYYFFVHQYIFHTEEYDDIHLQQHVSYTYYWISQYVNHVTFFMCEFKQRMKDNFISESPKCHLYRYIFDNNANTISSYINIFVHTEEYDDIHLQQHLSYTYYALFHDHLNHRIFQFQY